MTNENDELRKRVEDLEAELAALRYRVPLRCIRKRSTTIICGAPLYDIALGPDLERGEMRGHARGIIAIGDMATGVVAFGGLARGLFAFGGLAMGGFTFGGCSVGLILAIGGLAIGGIALGGGALGLVAMGGGALGYYAMGGGAAGEHVISAAHRDPEAVRFFSQWLPGFDKLLLPRG
jgi:hypothetical protein